MTDAVPASHSYRNVRLALVVSAVLNMLIIGALAGNALITRSGHWRGAGASKSLLGFARSLPRERFDLIRQNVAEAQASLKLTRRGIRDARSAARLALARQPFDQTRFSAALEGIVQAETGEKRAKVTLFAKTVGQLTPEERRQLRDWVEKRGKER